MSEAVINEQLRALGVELGERLDAAYVKAQRIQWIEELDEEGEVTHIPVLDEFGIGKDAMIVTSWPAGHMPERRKAVTIQMINLELLEDVGPEKLAEMLVPDLEHQYAELLASDKEQ